LGNRTVVFVGLVGAIALIPWIVGLINRESILEDGEQFTYHNSQWILIPAAYLASWLLIFWDLCWASAAFVAHWISREPSPVVKEGVG
jgi:hypothetical protein